MDCNPPLLFHAADVERSILSLYGEVTSMLSVLGLNLGEFAVAADMSRCTVRTVTVCVIPLADKWYCLAGVC